MKYLFIYIGALMKYLIVTSILSGVIIYFFPNTFTLIISGLLFIGSFPAASKDVKERKMEESKAILKTQIKKEEKSEPNLRVEPIKEKEEVSSTEKKKSIFENVDLD
ncbi:MAG: hypothetical protein ACRCZO_10820 [Cetobacterium sp.]|uniref:hypothetical protein n=1 Tax=Cetobacterium sp. TaxID=2071632 RepID=UPI003F2F1051